MIRVVVYDLADHASASTIEDLRNDRSIEIIGFCTQLSQLLEFLEVHVVDIMLINTNHAYYSSLTRILAIEYPHARIVGVDQGQSNGNQTANKSAHSYLCDSKASSAEILEDIKFVFNY